MIQRCPAAEKLIILEQKNNWEIECSQEKLQADKEQVEPWKKRVRGMNQQFTNYKNNFKSFSKQAYSQQK